ncbi:MAG: hypothetical protein HGA97_00685 [Chlorobiaceae bacterium]|nr:hypothetical protein [Chlorobiaceae bacterium]
MYGIGPDTGCNLKGIGIDPGKLSGNSFGDRTRIIGFNGNKPTHPIPDYPLNAKRNSDSNSDTGPGSVLFLLIKIIPPFFYEPVIFSHCVQELPLIGYGCQEHPLDR